MAQYRRLPVVVDAFQWTGGPEQIEDPEWMVRVIREGRVSFSILTSYPGIPQMHIMTLRTLVTAQHGDWIVRENEAEIYPMDPDEFAATYEEVTNGQISP